MCTRPHTRTGKIGSHSRRPIAARDRLSHTRRCASLARPCVALRTYVVRAESTRLSGCCARPLLPIGRSLGERARAGGYVSLSLVLSPSRPVAATAWSAGSHADASPITAGPMMAFGRVSQLTHTVHCTRAYTGDNAALAILSLCSRRLTRV